MYINLSAIVLSLRSLLYLDHVTAEDVPAPVLVGGGGHHAARAGHAGPGQSPEMTAAADVTRSPDPGIYQLLIGKIFKMVIPLQKTRYWGFLNVHLIR